MSTLTGDSDTLDLVRIVFEFGEAPPLDESLCTTLIERHNVRKVRDVIYSLQGGGVHKVDSLVAGLCRGFSQTTFDAIDGEIRAEAFAVARRLPPAPAVGVPTPGKVPAWAFNRRRGKAPLVSRGIPVALGVAASESEPPVKKPRTDKVAAGATDEPKAAPKAAGSSAAAEAAEAEAAESEVMEPVEMTLADDEACFLEYYGEAFAFVATNMPLELPRETVDEEEAAARFTDEVDEATELLRTSGLRPLEFFNALKFGSEHHMQPGATLDDYIEIIGALAKGWVKADAAATLVLNTPYTDVIISPDDLLRVEAEMRHDLFSTLGIDVSWEVPLLEIMPGSLLVIFSLKVPAAVGSSSAAPATAGSKLEHLQQAVNSGDAPRLAGHEIVRVKMEHVRVRVKMSHVCDGSCDEPAAKMLRDEASDKPYTKLDREERVAFFTSLLSECASQAARVLCMCCAALPCAL